jgi:branched-chain amino acid transport system permease protein
MGRPRILLDGIRRVRLPRGLLNLLVVLATVGSLCVVADLVEPFTAFQIGIAAALFCAASGLTVLVGGTGQVSIGAGAFMAVGGYAAALVMTPLVENGMDLNLALVSAVVLATFVAAVAGGVFGLAGARVEGPYLAGLTLALVLVVPSLTHLFSDQLGGDNGLSTPYLVPPEGLAASVRIESWQAWMALVIAAVVALVIANALSGRSGRVWRAVRDDEIGAQLVGTKTRTVKVQVFALSAAVAGAGGALLTILNGLASPGAFGLMLSVQLLTAIVLGGMTSLWGAALGSAFVVFIPSWLSTAISRVEMDGELQRALTGNLPLMLYGVILLLMVIFAPRGILGLLDSLRTRIEGRARRRAGETA